MSDPALRAGDEMQRWIIDTLRADGVLNGLLFPTYAPQISVLDLRVYGTAAELPEDPQIREALPRVEVECVTTGFMTEQQAEAPLDGEVTVYVHSLSPKGHEMDASAIDARVSALLLSTRPDSVRIIAAGLSYEGQRRKSKLASFNDAWEIVTQLRSPHVGVIA